MHKTYTRFKQRKRLLVMIILIAFLFTAIFGRLLYVEIFQSNSLQIKALEQWMRDVPLKAERGEIYDRNGVLLADSNTSYTVYVRPVAVVDKEYTAKVLSMTFSLDYDEILNKTKSKRSEMTVQKNVTKQQMLILTESKATGIYFSETIERVYPYGDFMSQILGFTNADSDGQTGVEMQYNQYLKGIDGYILTETDLIGRELDSNVTKYVVGTKGNTAYLTIDSNIQFFVETAVEKAFVNHQAKSASCIVMDVNTGQIVAMAQKPSFDLNNIPRDNILELFSNSKSTLVSNVFEPGSTFKILTAAAGLETGKVTRSTAFFCPGYHIVDGQRIRCWKTIGHGSQVFDEGVRNSCNVLFMNTALALGSTTFYDYLERFGLTKKTGVDIQGEASGLTIPLASVKNVDLARIGFGQAIAVTPIELLTSTAAVINGGNLVTPYVLDRFQDASGKIIYQNSPKITSGLLSMETSIQMREVLESVVSQGSGRNAAVAGYSIGGKTGTAQKYVNGAIAGGKYVSTFIGFTPADNPKYIALMIVDEPIGQYYGSLVAAPYIGEIFAKIFEYEGTVATNIIKKEEFEMPNLIGLSINEASKILKEKNIYFEMTGEGGYVLRQYPGAFSLVTEDIIALIEF